MCIILQCQRLADLKEKQNEQQNKFHTDLSDFQPNNVKELSQNEVKNTNGIWITLILKTMSGHWKKE